MFRSTYLLAIMQHRAQHSLEHLEAHDQVQQVDGEVEGVPMQPHEAEPTVEDVVENQLGGEGRGGEERRRGGEGRRGEGRGGGGAGRLGNAAKYQQQERDPPCCSVPLLTSRACSGDQPERSWGAREGLQEMGGAWGAHKLLV